MNHHNDYIQHTTSTQSNITVTKREHITEKASTRQEQYTQRVQKQNKNSYNITGENSQSNILMATPSYTHRDCHLVQDSRKQTATAWSKEKASFKRIQCKTSEKLRCHVSKRRLANCLRNTSV